MCVLGLLPGISGGRISGTLTVESRQFSFNPSPPRSPTTNPALRARARAGRWLVPNARERCCQPRPAPSRAPPNAAGRASNKQLVNGIDRRPTSGITRRGSPCEHVSPGVSLWRPRARREPRAYWEEPSPHPNSSDVPTHRLTTSMTLRKLQRLLRPGTTFY